MFLAMLRLFIGLFGLFVSARSFNLNHDLLKLAINTSVDSSLSIKKRMLFVPESCLKEPGPYRTQDDILFLSTKNNSVHFGSIMLDSRRNDPLRNKVFQLLLYRPDESKPVCAYISSYAYSNNLKEVSAPPFAMDNSYLSTYTITLDKEDVDVEGEYEKIEMYYGNDPIACVPYAPANPDKKIITFKHEGIVYKAVDECDLAIPIGAKTMKEYKQESETCLRKTKNGDFSYENPLRSGYLSFAVFGNKDAMYEYCKDSKNWPYCSLEKVSSPRECARRCLGKSFCQFWSFNWNDEQCVMQTYLYLVTTLADSRVDKLANIPKKYFCRTPGSTIRPDHSDSAPAYRFTNDSGRGPCLFFGYMHNKNYNKDKTIENEFISGSKVLNEPIDLALLMEDEAFTDAVIEAFEELVRLRGSTTTSTTEQVVIPTRPTTTTTTELSSSELPSTSSSELPPPSSSETSSSSSESEDSKNSTSKGKIILYSLLSAGAFAGIASGTIFYVARRISQARAAANDCVFEYSVDDATDALDVYYQTDVYT